jgi:hypothetical protein
MEQLEEIQKKGKSWLVNHLKKEDEKQSRVNAQLTKLKKHGENPLVAAAAAPILKFNVPQTKNK